MRTLILLLLLSLVKLGSAQEVQLRTDTILKVGIKASPPFVSMREGFSPEGMSIEFWNQIEETAQLKFEFVIYEDLQELLTDLENGKIDLSINPVTVTEDRMRVLDFSQPYFISGTAMVTKETNLLIVMMKVIFSFDFLYAVSSFLLIIGVVGVLMWLIERRRNRTMFHPGAQGIGDGIWWSAVTMTTVGYGDKAPRTKMGRVVGFFWMFVAIVLVSGLTAYITSSLTNSDSSEEIATVADLRNYKVATVAESSTEEYLRIFKVEQSGYSDLDKALEAVNRGDVDVVVYDRPILTYFLRRGAYQELSLSSNNLKRDYYCFTYPKGSALEDKLDPYIVKVLLSGTWNVKLKLYEDL